MLCTFARMFDGSLPEPAELATLDDARLVEAAGGWARVENAACARKQAVMAELFHRRSGAAGSDERESWWLDPCSAVGSELAGAQGISQGLALAQTHRGVAARDRLPRVAALFAAGLISDLLVRAIVWRTALIVDADAMAAVDAALAEQVTRWGALSLKKTEQAIDTLVDAHDPGALRRGRAAERTRDVVIGSPCDEAGVTSVWARLHSTEATALKQTLDTMSRSVCAGDPRTAAERRADALGALAAGESELACECGNTGCPATERDRTPTAVVHVVADAATVSNATGERSENCTTPPEFVMGGGILPAPLLTPTVNRATLCEVRHPGDAPPEEHYRPSTALADFVRCRDLTCRFPGCDRPAVHCDLDHTVPYPAGPTHASNLKSLCRQHHLLKTFWSGASGWRDRQQSDGNVVWTSPTGRTYTTRPGSVLLFPPLCRPTGTLVLPEPKPANGIAVRAALMPKRRRTREQNRRHLITA